MMKLRAAEARGKANFGWLDARHSFSFGHYYDPEWMGHSALRVINQDLVAPGGGFATHPHANMEILTCVLSGTIEHRDSLGHAEQIPAGDSDERRVRHPAQRVQPLADRAALPVADLDRAE